MFKKLCFTFLIIGALGFSPVQAQEGFIGEIRMFAGNYAPRGWALCDGQLLRISMHTALFSILGTTYGGDGRTTFALPDLRGRFAMHPGTGPGLTTRRLGGKGGTETTTLITANLPSHSHMVPALHLNINNLNTPFKDGDTNFLSTGNETNKTVSSQSTGQAQAINNIPPYQVVNYIICLTGTFPGRN